MTLIRKRIDDELDSMPSSDISLIYEQVMHLSRARRLQAVPSRQPAPSIQTVWQHTDAYPGNWSDDIIADREDRV